MSAAALLFLGGLLQAAAVVFGNERRPGGLGARYPWLPPCVAVAPLVLLIQPASQGLIDGSAAAGFVALGALALGVALAVVSCGLLPHTDEERLALRTLLFLGLAVSLALAHPAVGIALLALGAAPIMLVGLQLARRRPSGRLARAILATWSILAGVVLGAASGFALIDAAWDPEAAALDLLVAGAVTVALISQIPILGWAIFGAKDSLHHMAASFRAHRAGPRAFVVLGIVALVLVANAALVVMPTATLIAGLYVLTSALPLGRAHATFEVVRRSG